MNEQQHDSLAGAMILIIAAYDEELAILRRERDEALLAARREAANARHWKSNHADQVTRCALLRERPDLPVDRIPAYKELVRLQQARIDSVERDQALHWKLFQADSGACTCMTKTPDPTYHAERCRHRLIAEALLLLDQP